MNTIKFHPLHNVDAIARRMNALFDDVQKSTHTQSRSVSPSVDIVENETMLSLHAELPGLSKGDIQITVNEDRVLTLRGEKKREEKKEGRNYVRTERRYGSFTRSFTLPDNIDVENIKAEFNDGVLSLQLSKVQPEEPQEIAVEIA